MRKTIGAVLFVIVAVCSVAQEQYSVSIDTRVGFGGLFKPGHWTPVHFTLQNLGPEIRGSFVVQITRRDRFGPDRRTNSFERDLDLAAGSTKSFSMVLPIETAVYPMDVEIRAGTRTLLTREVRLSGRGAGEMFVATLSRRTSLDFMLPVLNSQTDRALDLVYPLVDFLPDAWQGYSGVDLLVVHDARLGDLRPDQIRAIREWVASGGRLVVSGGAHLGPSDASVLGRIVGREPRPVDVVRVGDLRFEAIGLAVAEDERDARTVVTAFGDGPASVSYSRHGRGEIILLPFDFAQLVRVAPVTSLGLWLSLLPAPEESTGSSRSTGSLPISMNRRVFETEFLANQLDLPTYKFPNRVLVAGLLVTFVVTVLAIFLWLRRTPSKGRSFVGILAIVLVAGITSFVSHLALNVGQQPDEALEFAMEIAETGPGDQYSLVTRDVAVFSRKRADYTVEFPDFPVVVPLDSSDQDIFISGDLYRARLPVDRWGHENAVAIAIREFDVTARADFGIGYANIELHNNSGTTLDGVVILSDGYPKTVGRVMDSEVVEHVVMGSSVGKWDQIDWNEYVPQDDLSEHRSRLLRDIARRQRDAAPISSILVFGWRSSPMIQSRVSPEFARRIELNAFLMTVKNDT